MTLLIAGAMYLVTALFGVFLEIASNPEATGRTVLRAAVAGPLIALEMLRLCVFR